EEILSNKWGQVNSTSGFNAQENIESISLDLIVT
ncbi:unnamed protein product, partial [marine sediment metagenome]